MRYTGLAVLVLGIAAAGCGRSPQVAATASTGAAVPAVVEQPKPPSLGADVPPALAAERNQRHKRQTGALLTVAARWGEVPHGPRVVRVDWSIDYDGPRKPFTILTPGRGTIRSSATSGPVGPTAP